jgi:hypothetical protein
VVIELRDRRAEPGIELLRYWRSCRHFVLRVDGTFQVALNATVPERAPSALVPDFDPPVFLSGLFRIAYAVGSASHHPATAGIM